MNTNLSQHQFNPSQSTHHLQPIQPKPQPIQATAPPLKHQLPPELKPKWMKRERQLKPKTDLKHNLYNDPYPNLISTVTQTRSHRETQPTPKRPPPIRTQQLLKQPTTLNPVTTNSTQPKTTEKETEKREKKNQNREKRGETENER